MAMPRNSLRALALCASAAFAATLPYQGLSTDSKGNPRADGNSTIVFSLYTEAAGGIAVWSESQTLATRKGLFSATLGSVKSIPDGLFDGRALWLGVALDGGAEASPRLRLGSAPFANGAGLADSARSARRSDTADVSRRVIGADSARLRADSVAIRVARDSIQSLQSTIGTLSSALSALFLSQTGGSGVPWNSSVAYGTMIDLRDGRMYRTVKIGTQTWLAQNLNFHRPGSDSDWCYGNSGDSCEKYGRMYVWSEAMDGAASSDASPSGVRGICPAGWHLPSDGEWTRLTDTAMDSSTAGSALRSVGGWADGSKANTDTFGFRVLPGGFSPNGGASFSGAGSFAFFWSSTESDSADAWLRMFSNTTAKVWRDGMLGKGQGFHLRCVKD